MSMFIYSVRFSQHAQIMFIFYLSISKFTPNSTLILKQSLSYKHFSYFCLYINYFSWRLHFFVLTVNPQMRRLVEPRSTQQLQDFEVLGFVPQPNLHLA